MTQYIDKFIYGSTNNGTNKFYKFKDRVLREMIDELYITTGQGRIYDYDYSTPSIDSVAVTQNDETITYLIKDTEGRQALQELINRLQKEAD